MQANTIDDEDQNSDVDDMMADQEQETDVDAASSVLSQSLRSSHSYNGGDPNRYYRYVYLFDKESQFIRLDLKLGKVESTGYFWVRKKGQKISEPNYLIYSKNKTNENICVLLI